MSFSTYLAPSLLLGLALGATAPQQGVRPAQGQPPELSAAEIRELRQLLGYVEIVHLDDGQGGRVKTLRIRGLNVQIVNGSGSTGGSENGLGNLILGDNELGNSSGDARTGSHNLVVGARNSYSSSGGVVIGPRTRSRHPSRRSRVESATVRRAKGPP